MQMDKLIAAMNAFKRVVEFHKDRVADAIPEACMNDHTMAFISMYVNGYTKDEIADALQIDFTNTGTAWSDLEW